MSECEQCGATFYDASAAWGGHVCGDCLADRIELTLMSHIFGAQRKPMRRANSSQGAVGDPALADLDQRRSA